MAEETPKQKQEEKSKPPATAVSPALSKTEAPQTTKPQTAIPTSPDKKSSPPKTESLKKEPRKSKEDIPEISKKEQAIANGENLHASKKHCMYICSFIKNKSIDAAIQDLELVILKKKVVPFKGEIPHRKGPGLSSGRFPNNASKLFIALLKGLKGNVLVNQMDLDKTIISEASASWASRPARKGNRQAKRSNVFLIAREKAVKK
jgi:ribosomal protein L22